ncbi:MAG: glycosyltransferase family 39 protein, partial [Anaerolineae bacterium]
MRFHRIGSQGLWIDEAFSIWLARRPLGEMLHWVAEVDQHPPLYYALLHGWTEVFGDSEASARSLSALFGSLTIPVVYLLGRRLSGEKVGLLAALILAVSPFHVRFAQEARMYTLLALNVSLGLYAVTRLLGAVSAPGLLERRAGRLCWIAHVACTGAALWTHNTAIFFPVGVNLFVFSHLLAPRLIGRGRVLPHPRRSRFLRHWILAQAAILLLWLPWFPAFVSQAIGVYRRFWLPAPSAG